MPEVIYGRNPVVEALKAGTRLDRILISASLADPKVTQIVTMARTAGVSMEEVPASRIVEIVGENAQGVVAYLPRQSYATVDQILGRSRELKEAPLVALLDGIEDPHNFGAILRAADGAGVHGVILPKKRSVGLTATVAKVSAGASAHVRTTQVSNLNQTMAKLKNANLWLVGADQSAGQAYTEADLSSGLGIVIGGEGRGLHRLVKENCDFLVRIPMFGRVNSLNASVAAALLFFEARRQRERKLL